MFLLLFALTLLSPSFLWAECSLEYARLEQAIASHFTFDVPSGIHGPIRIPTHEEAEKYLDLARRLWKDNRPTKDLAAAVTQVRKTGELPPEVLVKLKEMRARLRIVRFLCQSICEESSSFAHFDQLIKKVGGLKDFAKYGNKKVISKQAARLEELLNKSTLKKIDREIEGLSAMSTEKIQDETSRTVKEIRKLVNRKSLSEEQFHDVRKGVGRLQASMLLNIVRSAEGHEEKAAFAAFRQVYTKLGDQHDEMVRIQIAEKTHTPFVFTEEQRTDIEEILSHFP